MASNEQAADPLRNIYSYNEEMTISQVVRFFERQGISYSKPMIQSYVRQGVLPPPRNKRSYTRAHLVLLVMIDRFKKAFTFEEMKRAFGLITGEPEDFAGKSEEMMGLYNEFLEIYDRAAEALSQTEGGEPRDNERFLNKITHMSNCAVAREMATKE